RCDLSQTVFADGLAIYRPVLSLSASAAGLAEGHARMGRRLVVPGLQRSPHDVQPLVLAADRSIAINDPAKRKLGGGFLFSNAEHRMRNAELRRKCDALLATGLLSLLARQSFPVFPR